MDCNKNFRVIKVYDKNKAPKEAIFWYTTIEENGFIKQEVVGYGLLKPGQKYVYFYKVSLY